jgi:hypothetical protein
MDEWIEVTFPEVRDVLVDDAVLGTTNQPFLVESGNHTVTLGGAQNYKSPHMPVAVYNTTKALPMVFVFTLA